MSLMSECRFVTGGLLFYRSANNVILCPGDENGFINTKYFDKVYDVTKGVKLDY